MTGLESLNVFLAPPQSSGQMAVSLALAVLLGAVSALVHRFTRPGLAARGELEAALVMLSVVSALVMLVIGDSLARAFSLVGALAIIRFRTRVQSSWDIAFVFLALALGIGCGVLAWRAALIGASVATLVALGISRLGVTRPTEALRLRFDLGAYGGTEAGVMGVLDQHGLARTFEEVISLRFGETLSYRYQVLLPQTARLDALVRDLSAVEGVERVIVSAVERPDEGEDTD